MTDKTAIFFGPAGGAVHRLAKKIRDEADGENVVMVPVKDWVEQLRPHFKF